ncbi:GNAT family N-acetyltransferase [Sedimentibacter sp. zth1]|uniref:GNAT family N-acetyltransferase n=1 Tax=Sedimentibacter sp. zth1 TaxID=2816908 RepID=UPI001A91379C|nr:GNAT family N-acetyltransferase [Sedimentibacter sp. zth1]QSX05114.1 GNAT family N-acetyltransferase [Sedimentibacter sp. zth1]
MNIRKIEDRDLEQVYKLHTYCTGRHWTDGVPAKDSLAFYTPDEILGMFDDDKLVSMIRNYTFKQLVRGVIKNMGGVSHVATFPEYRMCGYVKELTKSVFNDMKDKKQSVSMLHPFKKSFYSEFGYVGANDNILVKVSFDALSHYLKHVPNIDAIWKEERERAVDIQEEYETFKYSLDLSNYHGLVFLDNMSNEYWVDDHEDVIVVFIKKDDEIVATAKYLKIGYGENGKLMVLEMFWKDIESRFMIFRYFAKHTDQFSHIEMRIPFGTNFYTWLSDSSRPFEVKINNRPWMVRIIDVLDALRDIPVKTDGKVFLELYDEYCKWNNGGYMLKTVGDKLKITKLDNIIPQLRIDIRGLTSLLYGIYSVEELEFKNWINIIDNDISEILNDWFPKQLINNPYYY